MSGKLVSQAAWFSPPEPGFPLHQGFFLAHLLYFPSYAGDGACLPVSQLPQEEEMSCVTMHQQEGWRCLVCCPAKSWESKRGWAALLGSNCTCWDLFLHVGAPQPLVFVQLPVRPGFPPGDRAGRVCEHTCGVTGPSSCSPGCARVRQAWFLLGKNSNRLEWHKKLPETELRQCKA